MLPAGGDVGGPVELEEQQRAAVALVLAAELMHEAVAVELLDDRRGQRCIRPGIGRIPPRNHLAELQILGAHQELRLLQRPMNVRLARPPTFGGQIDQPVQCDGNIGCRLAGGDFHHGRFGRPLGAALDGDRVTARGHDEHRPARRGNVIVPERQISRRPHRSAIRPGEMDSRGNDFATVAPGGGDG